MVERKPAGVADCACLEREQEQPVSCALFLNHDRVRFSEQKSALLPVIFYHPFFTEKGKRCGVKDGVRDRVPRRLATNQAPSNSARP
jgi:hypothetical protein